MSKNKVNIKAVMAAATAGGGFNFAIEGISKKVEFVNDNYLVVKSLGGAVLGTGMVYFAKPNDEVTKAAGYGILGAAGASAAAKLSTVLVTNEEPVNGLSDKTKKILKRVIDANAAGRGSARPQFANVRRAMEAARGGHRPSQQAYHAAPRAAANASLAAIWGGDYSDGIY